jgi:AcrR family transcriptional regulator
MSRKGLETGRIKQKQRTRKALLDAADELLRRGITPTIEEVTAAAMVSRATFYRYFDGVEALVLAMAPVERTVRSDDVLSNAGGARADERVVRVYDALFDMIVRNEPRLRFELKSSLERMPDAGLIRQRFDRTSLIEDALEPIGGRLDDTSYDRLVYALTALTGIETYVALRDVCGLEPDDAGKVVRWATRVLVEGAVEGGRREAAVDD